METEMRMKTSVIRSIVRLIFGLALLGSGVVLKIAGTFAFDLCYFSRGGNTGPADTCSYIGIALIVFGLIAIAVEYLREV